MRTSRSWRFWLAVSSPLLVMGACGIFSIRARRMVSAAEREAAVFHQRVAARQYDTIYDTAAPAFQSSLNRLASAKYFAAIRDKIAACKPPDEAPAYVTNTTAAGTRVQLRYRLACANGVLEETMLYVISGDRPRLAGYIATSPALAMK